MAVQNGLSPPGIVTDITSVDGSVTLSNPKGQIIDLSVNGDPAPILYDLFTGKGTTPLITADTGQSWYLLPPVGVQAMTIVNGKLTATAIAGPSIGYAQVDIGAPVTRIGGVLDFTPYSTNGGCAAFPVWKTLDTGSGVPDSNCHLVVTPTQWIFGTWLGGVFTQIANANFATPLLADSATGYRVDAVMIGNTIYIYLPDGTIAKVTDPSIGNTPGHIATFENYQPAAGTDTRTQFHRVWADTRPFRNGYTELPPYAEDTSIYNVPLSSSVPNYIKGALYFDTTLNKLRVGGAAAWETITSV